jgi:LuxR family maltose regulon positive regulatory protein
VVETIPELAFSEAWVKLFQGKDENAFNKLPHLESLLTDSRLKETRLENLWGEWYALQAYNTYITVCDVNKVVELSNIAFEKLDPQNIYPLAITWTFYCASMQAAGKSAEAIKKTCNEINNTRSVPLSLNMYVGLHYIYFLEADIENLITSAQRSFRIAEEQNDLGSQCNCGLLLAQGLYPQNKIKESISLLEKVYPIRYHTIGIQRFNFTCILIFSYLAENQFEKANVILRELREYLSSTNLPFMLFLGDALEAEVNWRSGATDKILQWLDNHKDSERNRFGNFFVPVLTRIKLLIYKNDAGSLKLAERVLKKTEKQVGATNYNYFKIEVFALQAMLSFEQGKEESAYEKLKASLQLAKPGHVIRVYIDLGSKMANLLNLLSKRETSVRFIAKILTAFKEKELNKISSPDTKSKEDKSQILISYSGDNLTRREHEILTLMSRHLQNKEIAEKLFISAETVKKHTSRIYHKLHVGNRREAVEKARALGLI